jgi:hypothetical protein
MECGHCDFLKCPWVGWGNTEERNPKSNICVKLPGFSQFFHETWQSFEVFEIPKLNLEVYLNLISFKYPDLVVL